MTNKNIKSHPTRAEASRKIVYQPPNYLEAPKPKVDGIKYRWVRVSAGGEDDSQNISKKRREGYEFVRAEEHPEFDAPTHETGKYAGVTGSGQCFPGGPITADGSNFRTSWKGEWVLPEPIE